MTIQANQVGDVNSIDRGSAARYNNGKVAYNLIPLYMICSTIDTTKLNSVQEMALVALNHIANFQRTHEEIYLDFCLDSLKDYWHHCANVFDYGRKKYAEWNWVKGMLWSIPIGCIARHALAIINKNEIVDEESGLPHIGHILCNVVMLKCYIKGFEEGNDLPPKDFRVLPNNTN